MSANADDYIQKIKDVVLNIIPNEPDYVQNVFIRSFSLNAQKTFIKYVEPLDCDQWLVVEIKPTDQELTEYVKWCWKYHQKKLETDDMLSDIRCNPPNDKCFHF